MCEGSRAQHQKIGGALSATIICWWPFKLNFMR
jgi:hypothetical protein